MFQVIRRPLVVASLLSLSRLGAGLSLPRASGPVGANAGSAGLGDGETCYSLTLSQFETLSSCYTAIVTFIANDKGSGYDRVAINEASGLPAYACYSTAPQPATLSGSPTCSAQVAIFSGTVNSGSTSVTVSITEGEQYETTATVSTTSTLSNAVEFSASASIADIFNVGVKDTVTYSLANTYGYSNSTTFSSQTTTGVTVNDCTGPATAYVQVDVQYCSGPATVNEPVTASGWVCLHYPNPVDGYPYWCYEIQNICSTASATSNVQINLLTAGSDYGTFTTNCTPKAGTTTTSGSRPSGSAKTVISK